MKLELVRWKRIFAVHAAAGGVGSGWSLWGPFVMCVLACAAALSSCSSHHVSISSVEDPRGMIERLIPRSVRDRAGWAEDIYTPFVALGLEPTAENVCAVIAVVEQESGFQVNPTVPDLPQIAMRALDERAQRAGVPLFLVHSALQLTSSTGRTYSDWIASARTEKDLSDIFEDFTGQVPLGTMLFARWNPIRTRGPMQVSIDFAKAFVHERPYPYHFDGSLGNELFTRRGGLYFGIAHLLDYPASYSSYLYRFADFNAGQYASRNAAFQNAVAIVSGVPIPRDGALLPADGDTDSPGLTQLAIQLLVRRLNFSPDQIRSALAQGRVEAFERTALYRRVFALAERTVGHPLPRAMVPQIELHGPKLTRKLTTAWYARRVDERFERCERQED